MKRLVTAIIFTLFFFNIGIADEFDEGFDEEKETTQSEEKSDFDADFDEDSSENDSDEFSGNDSFASKTGLEFTGFFEIEQAGHVGEKGAQDRQWILQNQRLRLKTSGSNEKGKYHIKLDVHSDSVTKEQKVDLREGRLVVSPLDWMDISIGKQVSTWGVADMLFINDLFPKNWLAIFTGREQEFYKESANALRVTSYFTDNFGFDIVYTPEFSPDVTPTGCRFSVFNPNSLIDPSQEKLISNTDSCTSNKTNTSQDGQYENGEIASRLSYKAGSHEFALYTYSGFYKNPKNLQWGDSTGKATGNTSTKPGLKDTQLIAYYARLNVYGFSAEGQLGPGIYSTEIGYYESREDREGDNPLLENSSFKSLIGYRMDLTANFSFGMQWLQEQMQDYDHYEQGILDLYAGNFQKGGKSKEEAYALAEKQDAYIYRKEEVHNTYTTRLTYKAQQETLWLSLFVYERPQDRDQFVKIDIKKQLDNHLTFSLGANIFKGEDNRLNREFGMMRNDDNMYTRLRYIF